MAKIRKALICFLVLILLLTASISQDFNTITANAQEGVDEYVFRRSWGGEGYFIDRPQDVTVGPDGTIYVVGLSDRIIVIKPGERIFKVWTAENYAQSNSIAIDQNGYIYVSSLECNCIKKYTNDGSIVKQWGSWGDQPGEFYYPDGLAINRSNEIFVVDSSNHRIQKFDANGSLITLWGTFGNLNGQFDNPHGVALDQEGNVYIADTGNNRIQVFSSNGSFIKKWGSEGDGDGQFNAPQDVAVDRLRNVYVSDFMNDRIQKFSSSGVFIRQWGNLSGDGSLFRPLGIFIDEYNCVYVADYLNRRIQKYTQDGNYLTHWGASGNTPGLFIIPKGIEKDGIGNIYVSDWDGYRVQKFSSVGTYILGWGSSRPTGISIGIDNKIYVSQSQISSIQVVDLNGVYLDQWGSYGSLAGQFINPNGIDIDINGQIYVADTGNNRIQVFSSTFQYLYEWGSEGGSAGQFRDPEDLAVGNNGHVYVVDTDNHRIQEFNSNGTFISQWGSYGSGLKEFISPSGIDIDLYGNILIADQYNNRIQIFTSTGSYISQFGVEGLSSGQLNHPVDVLINDQNDIFVVESGSNRIQVFSQGLPQPDPYSGLVLNGTFESIPSLTEWTYGGDLPVSRSTHAAQGSYALQLGVPVVQTEQGLGDAWAHSTFYVRPEWDRPTLSFKYNMFVNDIMDYSDFFVAIQDGVGLNHLATVVRDGFQPCIPGVAPSPGRDLGWRSVTYDLSAYKGQHIRLVFSNRNLWPGSWGIWTYVDDVRVIDAGPLPPMLGPYFSYLPLINNYRCDPVTFSGLNSYDKSIFRENLND